jgi:hypothetical protein
LNLATSCITRLVCVPVSSVTSYEFAFRLALPDAMRARGRLTPLPEPALGVQMSEKNANAKEREAASLFPDPSIKLPGQWAARGNVLPV